jgi:hypothetical protein
MFVSCEGRDFCDWPIPRPEDPRRACVCVCVCVTAIRYNSNPLHLQRVGSRDPTTNNLFQFHKRFGPAGSSSGNQC